MEELVMGGIELFALHARIESTLFVSENLHLWALCFVYIMLSEDSPIEAIPKVLPFGWQSTEVCGLLGSFSCLLGKDVGQSRRSTTAGERLGFKILVFPSVSQTCVNSAWNGTMLVCLFLIFVYSSFQNRDEFMFFFQVLGEILSNTVIQVWKDKLVFKMSFSEVVFPKVACLKKFLTMEVKI